MTLWRVTGLPSLSPNVSAMPWDVFISDLFKKHFSCLFLSRNCSADILGLTNEVEQWCHFFNALWSVFLTIAKYLEKNGFFGFVLDMKKPPRKQDTRGCCFCIQTSQFSTCLMLWVPFTVNWTALKRIEMLPVSFIVPQQELHFATQKEKQLGLGGGGQGDPWNEPLKSLQSPPFAGPHDIPESDYIVSFVVLVIRACVTLINGLILWREKWGRCRLD